MYLMELALIIYMCDNDCHARFIRNHLVGFLEINILFV